MYTFEDWVDSKLKHEITHAHTHTKNNNKKHKNQKYTQQKMKKKSHQVPSLVKVSRVHLYP